MFADYVLADGQDSIIEERSGSDAEDDSESDTEDDSESDVEDDSESDDGDDSKNNNQGVNLQSYGAVGDGVTDDTAALQAAFDSGNDLVSDANNTYLVTSLLSIDTNSSQEIDFNGSKIEKNFSTDYVIYINKAGFANSLTTLKNLEVDGNSNHGSLVYANSRIHFENVEIHHAVENTFSGGPRGLYIAVSNNVGLRGEWILDNVTIHDIRNDARAGVSQPHSGNAQGLQINWPVTVSGSGMQFVMKNSEVYNVWGDEGNGIIVNSPNHDISYTNNTLWFENVTIRECERRAHKGYIGNQTWVNSNIHAVDRTNPNIDTRSAPAGLFNIGAGSGANASENNLICGLTFHGAPTTPLDSWETVVVLGGSTGPSGVEVRNCTLLDADDPNTRWSYDYAGMSIRGDINFLKICNSYFGTATGNRGIRLNKSSSFNLTGSPMQIDSNNTYSVGQTAALASHNSNDYIVSDLSGDCDVCPTID